MDEKIKRKSLLMEIDDRKDSFNFEARIDEVMDQSDVEIGQLNETIDSIQALKNEADKVDYMLAASIGALTSILDIFLVGKPGESPAGEITDQWFANRTKDFAKLTGWTGGDEESLSSAVRFLEKKFDIPYDQTGAGDIGATIYGMTPRNHHFKSLGHQPSIVGLFYSILNQFQNTSTFVTENQLITLDKADNNFELIGNNLSGKLFAAISNWFGHLISDLSGSSSSKGRGMGIPSPLWTWSNSVIAMKRKMKVPVSVFNQSVNELALTIFNEGYDIRFQTAQAVLVLVNELLVRFLYSLRRLIQYFTHLESESYRFEDIWEHSQPFTHPTVKRMLTVAHGSFCLVDLSDATIRSYSKGLGVFQPTEFFLRLNLVGVGRFTFSLYGEGKQLIAYQQRKKDVRFAQGEKVIVEDYLEGLKELAEIYDDDEAIQFIRDFTSSDLYLEVFEQSVSLAEKRKVSDEVILKNKREIDQYFRGERND